MTETELGCYLKERKALVEQALNACLPPAHTEPRLVHEAMRYATLSGGKRLRPIFTLAIGELGQAPADAFLDTACAIELAHTASLILDDLPCMDNAALRRGVPCTHVQFDKATALLTTVSLLALAFELTAKNAAAWAPSSAAAVGLLARAVGTSGLVYGQHLDLCLTGQNPPIEALERVHHLKAGALFLAAIRIPALLLGLADADMQRLEQFGKNVGLAFQITDDLLDEEKTAEDAGKSTFATHLGREGAQAEVKQLIAQAIAALEPLGAPAEPLRCLAAFVGARKS